MKNQKPLLAVNSVILEKNKILLLKRVREPYIGYWSMPGGKIEFAEHIEEAAVRELKEETNIDAKFEKLCGIASEVIYENNQPKAHFILFICKLKHLHTNTAETREGELKWFDINGLDNQKIIPSDRQMIKEFILKDKKLDIHKIKIKQNGQKYFLEGFGL